MSKLFNGGGSKPVLLGLTAGIATILAVPANAQVGGSGLTASPPATAASTPVVVHSSQPTDSGLVGQTSTAPSSASVSPNSAPVAATTASNLDAGPPLQLNYTDARPPEERKTRQYLTLWRFSCEFGVQELGDQFLDRVGKLRHDLTVAYGKRLVGRTIVVDHYHIYLNQRSMKAANSWGTAMVGVLAIGVGAGAKTSSPACPRDQMAQGWFDPSELTTPWSPFIVELDVRIDGQPHHIHSVYSPPKNMPAPGILTDFDVAAESAAVHATVDKANAALISELEQQLRSTDGVSTPTPVETTAPTKAGIDGTVVSPASTPEAASTAKP